MESKQCYISSSQSTLFTLDKSLFEGKGDNGVRRGKLNTILEKLQRKSLVLQDLDSKIADAIQTPEELETEVFEAEKIQDDIPKMVDEVKRFLSRQAMASAPQQTMSRRPSPQQFLQTSVHFHSHFSHESWNKRDYLRCPNLPIANQQTVIWN